MSKRHLYVAALGLALCVQPVLAHPYELLIHLTSGSRTICANNSCGASGGFMIGGPCGYSSWVTHADGDTVSSSIPSLSAGVWYKIYAKGTSGSPESQNLIKIKFPTSPPGSVDTYLKYNTSSRYLLICDGGAGVNVQSIGYTVSLSGPSMLCKGWSGSFTASPVVSDPNVTYQWYRSYDGVSFTAYGNGANPQPFTMGTKDFWVKVRATFGYGQTAERVRFVDYGGIPGQGCPPLLD